MHTCFILESLGRSTVALNSVLGGFYTSFGGKPLHALRLTYTENLIEKSVDFPLNHVGTKYLGDGVACFSFTCRVEVEGSVSVTELKILSDTGEEVNVATLSEPFTVDGEGCVHVCAYVQINCEGFTLCPSPEKFFEYLYGVKTGTVTAKTDSGKIDVMVEKTEGKVIISADANSVSESEKMLFLCDNAPVFYVEAENQTAQTVEVTSIGHLLPRVPFGVEITQIAGGAVTLSDIAKRCVGCEVGAPLGFYSPFEFSFDKFRCSPCGNYVAFPTVNGWMMLKRGVEGFYCTNFFAEHLTASVVDCAFLDGKIYVLSTEGVKIVDCESGVEEFSSTYDITASRIFAVKPNRIILMKDTLVNCYSLEDSSTLIYQTVIEGAFCDYDFLTDTFTVISDSQIVQYKNTGDTYTRIKENIAIPISGLNGISARWGKVVATYQDGYEVVDLFKKTRTRYSVKGGKNYKCFNGGSLLAVTRQNGTDVHYLEPSEGDKLFSIDLGGEVFITPSGAIVKDKFYPFTASFNSFEINSNTDSGEFTILKEVPYFPQETVVLSFEAVV